MVIGASPGATDMAVDVGEEGAVVDLRIWTFLISGKDHFCSILLKADMNQCRYVVDIRGNFEPLRLIKSKPWKGKETVAVDKNEEDELLEEVNYFP